jgi:hypothetical protein
VCTRQIDQLHDLVKNFAADDHDLSPGRLQSAAVRLLSIEIDVADRVLPKHLLNTLHDDDGDA